VRDSIDLVFADSRIRQAFRFISDHESEIEADQIRLTEIPAPPFGETARAKVFADELARLHLRPITDSIGNVVAGYERIGRNPVIVAAHLDTVFPAATSLQLRRRGRMLLLPGISDNSAGIVALLWALRAAKQYEAKPFGVWLAHVINPAARKQKKPPFSRTLYIYPRPRRRLLPPPRGEKNT